MSLLTDKATAMALATPSRPPTTTEVAVELLVGPMASASAGTPINTGTTYSSPAISPGQSRLIQNHSTSPLFVSLGGTASSTVFSFIIPAAATTRDGTSPLVPCPFTGAITFYSAATLNMSVTTIS